MRDEPTAGAFRFVSSARSTPLERSAGETPLALEFRRTLLLLAVFMGLLILRFG